ncbi:uncharacterized protein KLLA0_E25147g [Kluyveromyces lactis]|uniref:KLLA0E25147p n=1 Tax=Kluyveromyces lactis (strain ATCC 8585 / CBS 2359 / DSM 70799 / NBRC 1267 / NRRL Y-1140 / WM37) TaxID=284590 RepID=Q6CLV7_KLULA|nr:uncharacterized protein KLLA0_E25147g [Kluyveromyces lactis]CAH00169.1 KLLA0E25147p [Kluyveromyces lactis]|eukprot:XP_455082.1 uncharacterized protein KLLA0_E25147g [Kluyveromyces lactis]
MLAKTLALLFFAVQTCVRAQSLEVPQVEPITTETTVFSRGPGQITTTYSTEVVTDDGTIPTVMTIYYVQIPYFDDDDYVTEETIVTTEYTVWTGTYTTTYSTEVLTLSGGPIPTVKTIYKVQTPDTSDDGGDDGTETTTTTETTEYTVWTGTYTTTYSTDVLSETGDDGIATVKTIYKVQTPDGTDDDGGADDETTATTETTQYTGWTGAYATTYSTDVLTETGEDGYPTIKTIYLVQTPLSFSNTTDGDDDKTSDDNGDDNTTDDEGRTTLEPPTTSTDTTTDQDDNNNGGQTSTPSGLTSDSTSSRVSTDGPGTTFEGGATRVLATSVFVVLLALL